MKELINHIEVLLQEHDCVIVPCFGGFVTYRLPAKWVEERDLYLPPSRTVGFNPHLVINDGLLAQAYMNQYGTSFPDAQKRVERAVQALKAQLYMEGQLDLNEIGVLHVSTEGTFRFVPYLDGLASPNLFGLNELHVSLLPPETEMPEEAQDRKRAVAFVPYSAAADEEIVTTTTEEEAERPVAKYRAMGRSLKWTASAAAVALLFTFYSQPLTNSLSTAYYKAEILSLQVLKSAKENSSIAPLAKYTPPKKAIAAETTMATTEATSGIEAPKETISSTLKEATPVKSANFYVVVSTWQSSGAAQKQLQELQDKGYQKVRVLSGANIQRVCIDSAHNRSEALQLLQQYRKDFKHAWVYQAPAND